MRRAPDSDAYDDPVRSLAAAVVLQAIEDAQRPQSPVNDYRTRLDNEARDDARAWLRGGQELEAWATRAGVEPDAVASWWGGLRSEVAA